MTPCISPQCNTWWLLQSVPCRVSPHGACACAERTNQYFAQAGRPRCAAATPHVHTHVKPAGGPVSGQAWQGPPSPCRWVPCRPCTWPCQTWHTRLCTCHSWRLQRWRGGKVTGTLASSGMCTRAGRHKRTVEVRGARNGVCGPRMTATDDSAHCILAHDRCKQQHTQRPESAGQHKSCCCGSGVGAARPLAAAVAAAAARQWGGRKRQPGTGITSDWDLLAGARLSREQEACSRQQWQFFAGGARWPNDAAQDLPQRLTEGSRCNGRATSGEGMSETPQTLPLARLPGARMTVPTLACPLLPSPPLRLLNLRVPFACRDDHP